MDFMEVLAASATGGLSFGGTLFFLKWATEFVAKRADKQAERIDEGTRLKSMLQGFGEARERASLIIAADKLEQKEKDGKA